MAPFRDACIRPPPTLLPWKLKLRMRKCRRDRAPTIPTDDIEPELPEFLLLNLKPIEDFLLRRHATKVHLIEGPEE